IAAHKPPWLAAVAKKDHGTTGDDSVTAPVEKPSPKEVAVSRLAAFLPRERLAKHPPDRAARIVRAYRGRERARLQAYSGNRKIDCKDSRGSGRRVCPTRDPLVKAYLDAVRDDENSNQKESNK